MKIIEFILLLSIKLNDIIESLLVREKYCSEEYIFRKTLKSHLLKNNPKFKLLIHSYYLELENSFSYVSVSGRENKSEQLLSAYNYKLKKLENSSKKKYERFKNQIALRDGEDSDFYNYLNSLSHKQLIEYFLEFENDTSISFIDYRDSDLRDYIISSYIDYEQIKFISKRISVLTKKARFYKAKLLIYVRDRRILFRKLLSFIFKNLDDYHDYSIIKNVQFKVIIPSVLILNNSINETKYIKANRLSFSFR